MGRHSAPGRGRGEQQARAERDARQGTQAPGSPAAQPEEHVRAHEPQPGQAHPSYQEPRPFPDARPVPDTRQFPDGRPFPDRPHPEARQRPAAPRRHPDQRARGGPWAPSAAAHGQATTQGVGHWDAWHTSLDSRQHAAPAGPRPEDVAVFDEPRGADTRARVREDRPDGSPRGRSPQSRPPQGRSPQGRTPRNRPAPGGPAQGRPALRVSASGPSAPELRVPAGRRRGTVARPLVGLLAAALTVGLAVSVADRAGNRERSDGAAGSARRDDSAASRSLGRESAAAQAPGSGANAAPGKGGGKGAEGADAAADLTPAAVRAQLRGRFPLPANLALSGAFTAVPGRDAAPGTGRTYRYRVDVEKGLPLDGELFAALVQQTLNDPRSWSHGGGMTFERVAKGRVDFVITLAGPATTDVWCAKSGLDTSVDKVSCDSANTERVMINGYRWAQGAATFGDDMLAYRQMLINHEVGHRLGHGHLGCPRDGALAPVMMQQTKFLTTGSATCKPNPWPFPAS